MPPVFWVWRNSWEPVMCACSIVATSEILKGSNSSGLMLREVPRSYRYKRPTYPRKMRCVSWRPSGKLFSVTWVLLIAGGLICCLIMESGLK